MELHLAEEGIVVIGIKGGIADERAVMKTGMCVKEVVHDGFQRNGITDFLVLVRVVGFWGNNFGMLCPEIVVEEGDGTDDAETVGNDARFHSVSIVTVDVLLARVGIGLGLIREKPVNELVRIQFGGDFCRLFRLFEFGIEEFGVVFSDGRFDSGGIIDEIIRFLLVDLTADGFRDFNKMFKELLLPSGVVFAEFRKL